MLYGQRPFGHNQSQEQLLSNRTMENLPVVVFPDETQGWLKEKEKTNFKKVSDAAKDFIRTCLKKPLREPHRDHQRSVLGGPVSFAEAGEVGVLANPIHFSNY